MKKVLFVVDERKMGGVSFVLQNILKNVNKDNKKIDLLILHNNGEELKNLENINIIYGNKFFSVIDMPLKEVMKEKNIIILIRKLYLIFLLKTGLIKNRIIKERNRMKLDKYDTEIAFKDGFCTIFTAYGNSSKKITWVHTDYSNNNSASKYMKTYCDAVNKINNFICISDSVKEKFNEVFKCQNKTEVINNYVDTQSIKKLSKDNDVKKEKPIEFIAVGRLNKVKGYERLIEVFNNLNNENALANVKLTIVGDGEERENLMKQVSKYSLNNIINFTLKKNNPYPYIVNKDAFILCSYSEAYPLTVIESLTLGVPVIATDYSSSKEMIKNKYNGLIVDNNEKSLYNVIKEVIENPKVLCELKTNLKNYKYDNERIIENINKLF